MAILAYGQTGTGKTWTMEGQVGSDEKQGVIPRSVRAIFEELEGRHADVSARHGLVLCYRDCFSAPIDLPRAQLVLCQSIFP